MIPRLIAPSALPAHGPATVAQRVADAVIGDHLPVIGRQQVSPCAVSIAVVYGFRICGVASVVIIRRPGQNVSAVVIAVLPGLARFRVLLPDKLPEGVILILRGLAAADAGNVPVGVVGIAEAVLLIPVAVAEGSHLGAGVGAVYVPVGIVCGQNIIAAGSYRLRDHAAEAVVGDGADDPAEAHAYRPLVVVIGVVVSIADAAYALRHAADLFAAVVGPGDVLGHIPAFKIISFVRTTDGRKEKLPPSVSSLKGKNVSCNLVKSQNIYKRRMESVMYQQASPLDIHGIFQDYS